MRLIHNFQNAKNVQNVASYAESADRVKPSKVYISIDYAEEYKNGLSGEYSFLSMEKDTNGFPTYRYIREPVPVPGYAHNMKFFLWRKKGNWSVNFEAVKSGVQSAIFQKTTTGKLLLSYM